MNPDDGEPLPPMNPESSLDLLALAPRFRPSDREVEDLAAGSFEDKVSPMNSCSVGGESRRDLSTTFPARPDAPQTKIGPNRDEEKEASLEVSFATNRSEPRVFRGGASRLEKSPDSTHKETQSLKLIENLRISQLTEGFQETENVAE